MPTLPSKAENLAIQAQALSAFHYINLVGIRSDVETLLSRIGTTYIFSQYTRHDISHIEAMLKSLDWIIPDSVKAVMSPADWLMITLSIYLHDLGLLVTQHEYDNRSATSFSLFKNEIASGVRGEEYATKVSLMDPATADLFLYQEFVRENHASRIRNWIQQTGDMLLGGDPAVTNALAGMLHGFEPKFRRDLAIICESHHLDDLNDLSKYKVVQPYGNTSDQVANLQFAAIVLRLADLLHVTRDRTPSLSFRIINPTDPKSIEEWHKQMAVVSVLPIPSKDKRGNALADVQSKVIGFHAYFTEPDGFFALTGYLAYVRVELRKIQDWLEDAEQKEGTTHLLPWDAIDESNIEAEGFLKEEFGFTLDKDKILQLLTGHTLYNNASVVVRELAQNAIDAVRLDAEEQKTSISGSVTITWSSAQRTLTVEDTGTGMTQRIIERHFLRAGSSRYKDPEFTKAHPHFSPISRFGIGVLSAFMVADEVEVTTCSRVISEKGRQLTLRALLGKYLIREFDRNAPEIPDSIREHGTRIVLRLRAGAQIADVAGAAANWIIFPACPVTLLVDNKKPRKIGFHNTEEAVTYSLRKMGFTVDTNAEDGQKRYDVRTFSGEGISFSVAVEWNKTFKEWTFLSGTQVRRNWSGEESYVPGIGTCVEGIRIDHLSPGFAGVNLIGVCNCTGKRAPHTNVARSEFEATPQRDEMLSQIYDAYCQHVTRELHDMQTVRGFSPTWAAAEASYLLGPLISSPMREGVSVKDTSSLEKSIGKIPVFPLERGGKRELVTLGELSSIPSLWVIDSSGVRSIEALLKEIPRRLSLASVSNLGDEPLLSLPLEPVLALAPYSSTLNVLALSNRQVTKFVARAQERRMDLLWSLNGSSEKCWVDMQSEDPKIQRYVASRLGEVNRYRGFDKVLVGSNKVEIVGLADEAAVRSGGILFLLPSTPLSSAFVSIIGDVENQGINPDVLVFGNTLLQDFLGREQQRFQSREHIARLINSFQIRTQSIEDLRRIYLADSFLNAIAHTSSQIFDASAWHRGQDVV